jgi:hypothetical protein
MFTVCLFFSPDLDRASLTLRDPENCQVPPIVCFPKQGTLRNTSLLPPSEVFRHFRHFSLYSYTALETLRNTSEHFTFIAPSIRNSKRTPKFAVQTDLL